MNNRPVEAEFPERYLRTVDSETYTIALRIVYRIVIRESKHKLIIYNHEAGQNYLLRSLGGGLNMLAESELVEDFSGEDYIILSEYLANFKKDDEGIPQITTEGSPLKKYEGYELDYENPYGSGRISIIKK